MSALLRRGSTGHSADRSTGHRPARAAALLLTVLLGSSACGDGGAVDEADEGAPTIGWSLFHAASHQPQLVGMLQRTRPPWAPQDPLVIAIHEDKEPPKRYQGTLPPNTLVRPTGPYTIFHLGRFGPRVGPDNQVAEVHTGTDLSANEGLPVVAALDGTVTDIFWDVWGGNRVEVAHVNGLTTTYNHLQHVQTRKGSRLQANEQLGTVGQTGARVTGPHLHFETWVDGEVVDPESFDWIDGDRIIPASRGPQPDVPVKDKQPLPAAKRDSAAIAASWGQTGGTLTVGQEKGGSPDPEADGAIAERKKFELDLQSLRGRIQDLEEELARLGDEPPAPDPDSGVDPDPDADPDPDPDPDPGLDPDPDPGLDPDPVPDRQPPSPPTTLPPPTGALDDRVEALEGQLRDLLAQVETLEDDFSELVPPDLPRQLTGFAQRIGELDVQVRNLEEQLAVVTLLQERVTSLEGAVAGLLGQKAVVDELQLEVDALRAEMYGVAAGKPGVLERTEGLERRMGAVENQLRPAAQEPARTEQPYGGLR